MGVGIKATSPPRAGISIPEEDPAGPYNVFVMIGFPPANTVAVIVTRHGHVSTHGQRPDEPEKARITGYQSRQSVALDGALVRNRYDRRDLANVDRARFAEATLPTRSSEDHSTEHREHHQRRSEPSTSGRPRPARGHKANSATQNEPFDLATVNRAQRGADLDPDTQIDSGSSVHEMLDAWLEERHLKRE